MSIRETRVRYKHGATLPMRITTQGAVMVGGASVWRDYGDCLLVYVDLHSKRAKLSCTIGGDDDSGPGVCLEADDNTLDLDESKPVDSETMIEFPELKGWSVFAADGPARYTLALTLLAPED